MKRFSRVLFLLGFTFSVAQLQASQALSYTKLLAEHAVGSTIHLSRNSNPLHSSHMDKCISISLMSYKSQPINVVIENGMILENSDTNHQDLVTLQPTYVLLFPNQQQVVPLHAVCCKLSRSCPDDDDVFKFNSYAKGQLAQAIDTLFCHDEYGNLAQEIVWCFTDKLQLSAAYNSIEDSSKENTIIRKIAKLMHIEMPKRNKEQERVEAILYRWQYKGVWEFEVNAPTTFAVYIVDSNNRVVASLWDADSETNLGSMKITYGYSGKLPKGKYNVIQRKNNELVSAKEVILPE